MAPSIPSRFMALTVAAIAWIGIAAGCLTTSTHENSNNSAASKEFKSLSDRADRKIVQLPNGLIVIAQAIPDSPVASVHCWIKTGSVYEQEHNGKGLSHFLEHLVSGGTTTTRPEKENNALLGKIGASTNAATGLDGVRYYINTEARHAGTAIELISDWMQNATIPQEEYARERDVIQREFQMGAGEPDRIFWKATQLARYRNHPARHPIIGYLDEFLAVSRDEIYDFYKRMYVPNNMVFVVAGGIDPAATVDQVAELWKKAEPKPLPSIRIAVEKDITAPRSRTAHADVDRPRLRLAWPSTTLGGERDYAMDLLGQILGQGELSRLVKTVRDGEQLVSSIDAFNYSVTWGKGFFGVDAVMTVEPPAELAEAERAVMALKESKAEADKITAAEQAVTALHETYEKTIDAHEQKTIAAIHTQIQSLIKDGVREDEMARAKRKTVSVAVFAAQTAHATAGRIAADFLATGNPDYLSDYAKKIQTISAEQVREAARHFLKDERLITLRLRPQKGAQSDPSRPTDDRDEPAEKFDTLDLDNATLVRRMKALEAGTAHVAAPDRTPVEMFRLDNGLRVLIQRDTRLPIAAMQWYQLGGLLADETGKEGVANAMATMMIKGAGGRSADDIATTLESLGAELSTGCGNSTFYASAMSLTADAPAVLELLATVIQQPDFVPAEWDKMRPRLLAAIASQDEQWYDQLRNRFRTEYFGEHPWASAVIGRKDRVATLTPADLKQFHQQRLNAANSVLAIFGDVDPAAVKRQVTGLFKQMPAQPTVAFKANAAKPTESRIIQADTDKPMAAVQIGYGPGIPRNHPDYPTLIVMNSVMSSFPVGWLDQALRGEGPGLVYAVGAGLNTGVIPGYWSVLFNTKPETIVPAMERSLNVVRRIQTETIDSDTLERARTKVLAGEASGRQSNSQRASNAALDELYGIGYDAGDQFILDVQKVTAADIHRAAQTYLKKPVAVIITNQRVPDDKLPAITPQP